MSAFKTFFGQVTRRVAIQAAIGALMAPVAQASAKTPGQRGANANIPFDRAHYPELWSVGPEVPKAMEVQFDADYARGSVVIDHLNQYAYVMQGDRTAWRFPIVVGKSGLEMCCERFKVMWRERNPGMITSTGTVPTGPKNALGSAMLGLVTYDDGNKDEGYRLHGTNAPSLLGKPDGQRKFSGGCVRFSNAHIEMFFDMVPQNALVDVYYQDEVSKHVSNPKPLTVPGLMIVSDRNQNPSFKPS